MPHSFHTIIVDSPVALYQKIIRTISSFVLPSFMLVSQNEPFLAEQLYLYLRQKMEAIVEANSPTNVTELKSYLGLLNNHGNFLPTLATILHPLHDLLQKHRPWMWTEKCDSAFVKTKWQL